MSNYSQAARSLQVSVKLHNSATTASSAAAPVATVDASNKLHLNVSTVSRFSSSSTNSLTATADTSFPAGSSNEQYYEEWVTPMVDSLTHGVDSSLLSFGGRDSGQQETWLGDICDVSADVGEGSGSSKVTLTPTSGCLDRLAAGVFDGIAATLATDNDVLVTVSACQVLHEFCVDLINPRPARGMGVGIHPLYGAYVRDLAELEVYNAAELRKVLREAMLTRRALQSRSRTPGTPPHTLITIKVLTKSKENVHSVRGGMLRVALLSPHDTVTAIDHGSSVVHNLLRSLSTGTDVNTLPYTRSQLTQLLQPVLSGASYLHVTGHVNTAAERLDDSVMTHDMLQCLITAKTLVEILPMPSSNNISVSLRLFRERIESVRKALLHVADVIAHEINAEEANGYQMYIEEYRRCVDNLRLCKSCTWDRLRETSLRHTQERVANMTSLGLALILTGLVDHDATATDDAAKATSELEASLEKQLADLVVEMNKLHSAEYVLTERQHKYQKLLKLRIDKGESVMEASADPKMKKIEQAVTTGQADVATFTANLEKGRSVYASQIGTVLEAEERRRQRALIISLTQAKEGMARQLDDVRRVTAAMATDETLRAALKQQDDISAEKVKVITEKFASLPEDAQPHKAEYLAHATTALRGEKQTTRLRFQCDQLLGRMLENDHRHEHRTRRSTKHAYGEFSRFRAQIETEHRAMEASFTNMMSKCVDDTLRLRDENLRLQSRLIALKRQRMRRGSIKG